MAKILVKRKTIVVCANIKVLFSCKSSFAAFDDGVLIRDPNFIEHSVSELFLDLCREQDPIEATRSNDQPSLNEHLATGGIARCFVVTVAPNAWVLKLP